MLCDTVARADPRLSGMLVAGLRALPALCDHCQSRRALRAPDLDWPAGGRKIDPLVDSVTSTAAAFTAFGVIPSWNNMVSYFPNGRPPLLALPSLVLRR